MYPIPSLSLRLPDGGPAWVLKNPSTESEIWLLGVVRPQRVSSSSATESTSPKKEERVRKPQSKLSPEREASIRAMFKMYQRGQVLRSMLLLGRLKSPVAKLTVMLYPDGTISLSEPVYTHSGDVWDTRSLEAEWRSFLESEKRALSTSSGDDTSGDS